MLKKILKPIRKQLLEFDYVKRAVSDYRQMLKVERWARIMLSGGTFRI